MLFRSVFRLAPDDHVWLLCSHPVVLDGTSRDLLFDQLLATYGALREGGPAPPGPPEQDFFDMIASHRSWAGDADPALLLASVTERLAGATPLPLTGDRPRAPVKSYRGTRRAWPMPPDVLRAVGAIGEREGVTLYICHLAALCALLSHYTGRPDVTVTTVLSTRERVAGGEVPTAAAQAGVFVNPVLLRCRWEGDITFAALLRLARSATLDAQHQKDVPVTEVLRALGWAGGALPPLVGQINLSAGTPPVDGRSGAGLEVEGLPRTGIKSEGDLGLFALGDPQARIEVQVEYDTDMFDGETAERLWHHLRAVLLGAAADTSTSLSALLSGVGPLVARGGRS